MLRILKEPLLHFVILGILVFTVYSLMPKSMSGEPGKIVVTSGQIKAMVVAYSRTWQRPPTAEELNGLVRDRVREEVYYREAMAMSLDKDDTVIRRRLRQKMEFISDDIAAQAEPTDEDLSKYLQAHPDAFRVERRFTFRQVYLNPEKHGDNLARDTAQLLAQLSQAGGGADTSALGDPFLGEQQFDGATGSEIAKQFGEKFAAKLGELSTGKWQGPIESGYGQHLVLVRERTEGRLPVLAEVRDAVRSAWANARRLETNEKFYQELLKRYTVTIENPQPVVGQK